MTASPVVGVWRRSHRAFYDAFASAAEGARVVALSDGLTCSLTPTAPDRSIPNAVLCDDADALRDALPTIRALYADAGVRAWTVWVAPGAEDVVTVCREAGLAHDGAPPLMHAALDDLDLSAPSPPGVVEDGPMRDVWTVDDVAFGMDFSGAFTVEPDAALRRVVAYDDDVPLGAVCWLHADDDAYVFLVGVVPEARGRGLCRGLMTHALRRARAEGAVTTTLEASPMGGPIYARMGYGTVGPTGLWEARVTDDARSATPV